MFRPVSTIKKFSTSIVHRYKCTGTRYNLPKSVELYCTQSCIAHHMSQLLPCRDNLPYIANELCLLPHPTKRCSGGQNLPEACLKSTPNWVLKRITNMTSLPDGSTLVPPRGCRTGDTNTSNANPCAGQWASTAKGGRASATGVSEELEQTPCGTDTSC